MEAIVLNPAFKSPLRPPEYVSTALRSPYRPKMEFKVTFMEFTPPDSPKQRSWCPGRAQWRVQYVDTNVEFIAVRKMKEVAPQLFVLQRHLTRREIHVRRQYPLAVVARFLLDFVLVNGELFQEFPQNFSALPAKGQLHL